MKRRAVSLLFALALAGAAALPVPAEVAGEIVLDEECGWEDILAAREALACTPMMTDDGDAGDAAAIRTLLERVNAAVAARSTSADISDLGLPRTTVKALLNDLCAQADGGEAIETAAVSYRKDSDTAAAVVLSYCTDADIAAMQQRLDTLTAQINTLCDTDLEKIVYLHEWLAQNFAYDTENSSAGKTVTDDHNARNALLTGTTVCEGYAKVYALAMRRLGLESVLVTSTTLGHAWNMVKLDGTWYQLDCTWDDATWSTDGGYSDALGFCAHADLLVSTETLKDTHQADDFIAFDLHGLGTVNIADQAGDTAYETAWWHSLTAPLFADGTNWYYIDGGSVMLRTDLNSGTAAALTCGGEAVQAGGMALSGSTLVTADKGARETSAQLTQYTVDAAAQTADLQKTCNASSLGLGVQWDGICYAESQQTYSQTVKACEDLFDDTPADYTGWKTKNGRDYWYENGVKQGTTGRGKEIYDPDTDAWYWLDAVDGGAKAVSKDVYQESSGGKWCRYDADGRMVKGWDTNQNGTYYFDPITGAMAKGDVTVDGLPCCFDPVTGIGLDLAWHSIDGADYWYEGGVRQGYDPDDPSYRGKEIYDPSSDAWYWLDNIQNGAKAVSKDVYQESSGGKWVRYDADGGMVKGWDINQNGTYYFDLITGAMAKGDVTVDGQAHSFDAVTGVMTR